MGYYIINNNYAKKEKACNSPEEKAHAILVNYCNYNCDFCAIDYAGNKLYKDYDDVEFNSLIDELLKSGSAFKFSGGEPTLNPLLEHHLKIIKNKGGEIFLDTNGSNPECIKRCVDASLIDVLGVSIKGLCFEEACAHTGIADMDLCWNNVLSTIKYAAESNKTRVIVTMVCFEDFSYDKAYKFYKMFMNYNIVYKFNNYKVSKRDISEKFVRCDNLRLEEIISRLINNHSELKERVVIINDERAVFDYKKIKFL